MNRTTFNAIGGWPAFPFLYWHVRGGLVFLHFVCSLFFYAFNAKSAAKAAEKTAIMSTARPSWHPWVIDQGSVNKMI